MEVIPQPKNVRQSEKMKRKMSYVEAVSGR
jgi:hypothetical protein